MRHRGYLFLSLLFLGTIVAAIGWLAEWNVIHGIIPPLHYTAIIASAGHLLQVIGAFGILVTPDRVERSSRIGDD